MLIQVIQPGDNLLQYLRSGNQEHGVVHVAGKGRLVLHIAAGIIGNVHELALLVEVRQAAVLHVFDGRENPLGNHIENLTGIVVFEFAPTHGLPHRRLRKNLAHVLAGHVLEFLRFQLLFVQRADEHEIGQLLDDGEGVGDTARPDVRPDFIYFIFNRTCDHAFVPPFSVSGIDSTMLYLILILHNTNLP